MTIDIVRALRDTEYRQSLTAQQRATLDLVELDDRATRNLTGGCGLFPTTPVESCVPPNMHCP